MHMTAIARHRRQKVTLSLLSSLHRLAHRVAGFVGISKYYTGHWLIGDERRREGTGKVPSVSTMQGDGMGNILELVTSGTDSPRALHLR